MPFQKNLVPKIRVGPERFTDNSRNLSFRSFRHHRGPEPRRYLRRAGGDRMQCWQSCSGIRIAGHGAAKCRRDLSSIRTLLAEQPSQIQTERSSATGSITSTTCQSSNCKTYLVLLYPAVLRILKINHRAVGAKTQQCPAAGLFASYVEPRQ